MEVPGLKKLEEMVAKAIKLIVQLRRENQRLQQENEWLRNKLEGKIPDEELKFKEKVEEQATPPSKENDDETLQQDSVLIRQKVEKMLSKFEELEL